MELWRFRYLDAVTGRWLTPRYPATLEQIAATYVNYTTFGYPEIRQPKTSADDSSAD